MRRLASALAVIGVAAVVVLALGGFSGSGGTPTYWVELDNAFGLVTGGDMKVAGVRAGTITDLRLDRRTLRALVQFKVTQNGFGSLRADASCQTRPQSLIGEYYLDCEPGTSSTPLRPGGVISVTQTTSTIAPDLVYDTLRQPYRERFRIILGELGAAAAGNAANLNAAIRRASPALRETDQVLAILASENAILANLARDGDTVVGALAANRTNVARWVGSANRAATVSATRQAQIAAGIQQLPGFLAELRPAMVALGQVADNTTPALQNLDASASQLDTFLNQLHTFSDVSQPAFRALGAASVTGSSAVAAAGPTINQLARFTTGVPELSHNLAIVLPYLDNRAHAVEKDPRSPGGQGYTGLEALLNYVFYQATSTTLFDANNHLLNVAVFTDPSCSPYPDVTQVKVAAQNPATNPLAKCISWLGPTQPGINSLDPTASAAAAAQAQAARAASAPANPQQSAAAAPTGGGAPQQLPAQSPQQALSTLIGNALNSTPPSGGGGSTSTSAPSAPPPSAPVVNTNAQQQLLNYLLAP